MKPETQQALSAMIEAARAQLRVQYSDEELAEKGRRQQETLRRVRARVHARMARDAKQMPKKRRP